MGRKSVAVLDVRSSTLTLAVGERGVNNTFVFRSVKTEAYSGYNGGVFFDEKELRALLCRMVAEAEKVCSERIRKLYVGVAGEFCRVDLQMKDVSFPKRRKIAPRDVSALLESGREKAEGYRFMRASCAIYTAADGRKIVDPVGVATTSLSGLISYCYCTEYFAQTMESVFGGMKIVLRFLPTQLAMACYLIPSETRDEYALLLDAGDYSTSVMVLQGNGVLAQETYPVGRAQIVAGLMETFGLTYEGASELLKRTNLYARSNAGKVEFIFRNEVFEFDSDLLTETVKDGLDVLCELVGAFLDQFSARELDYKPLYVTGEALYGIRGALEHMSKRIERVCELVSPSVPYYDKPFMSSYISLVDMACTDHARGDRY